MNREMVDEPPPVSVFRGGTGDRLLGRNILPLFVKSPACKSLGFGRCNRFVRVYDNDGSSVREELGRGVLFRPRDGSWNMVGNGEK